MTRNITAAAYAYLPASWQVLLADLSLILFITTATMASGQQVSSDASSLRASPTDKVYSSLITGEDIGEWLSSYPRDPRERLWITIHYQHGGFAGAVQRANRIEAVASAADQVPHIALEPAGANKTTAFFAYDMPPAPEGRTAPTSLARGLQ